MIRLGHCWVEMKVSTPLRSLYDSPVDLRSPRKLGGTYLPGPAASTGAGSVVAVDIGDCISNMLKRKDQSDQQQNV